MQVNYQTIKSNSELRWLSRNQLQGNWLMAVLACVLCSMIGGAVPIILTGPMMVGLSLCFLRLVRYNNLRFEDIFEGFKNFGTTCIVYILMSLFIFLWSLLLFIPGIIAGLSYAMAPYIIIDNPGISAMDAIKQSKEMMRGFKGKLFMLQLSFIGWSILCLFTCGIGFLWLTPYMQLSISNFYENLRASYGLSCSDYMMGGCNNMNGFNGGYGYNNANGYNNAGGYNNNYNNNGNMNYYNTNMGGYNGNYNNAGGNGNNYNNSANYNGNMNPYNNNMGAYNGNYNNVGGYNNNYNGNGNYNSNMNPNNNNMSGYNGNNNTDSNTDNINKEGISNGTSDNLPGTNESSPDNTGL